MPFRGSVDDAISSFFLWLQLFEVLGDMLGLVVGSLCFSVVITEARSLVHSNIQVHIETQTLPQQHPNHHDTIMILFGVDCDEPSLHIDCTDSRISFIRFNGLVQSVFDGKTTATKSHHDMVMRNSFLLKFKSSS